MFERTTGTPLECSEIVDVTAAAMMTVIYRCMLEHDSAWHDPIKFALKRTKRMQFPRGQKEYAIEHCCI